MRRAHRDLKVWREAIMLVEDIYSLMSHFPRHEEYALTTQMRRAAVSIPSNIAEGAARKSRKELLNFLSIASGSLSELDTQLEIAIRLGYVKSDVAIQKRMDNVFAMLIALARSLSRKPAE